MHLYEHNKSFGSNELSEKIKWIFNLLQDKEAAYGKTNSGKERITFRSEFPGALFNCCSRICKYISPPFDIDQRVAWSGNCDFPITGESHSLFLTGGSVYSFSVSINMQDNRQFRAKSENKSSSELSEVRGSGCDRLLVSKLNKRARD
ncbi:MAG: hypothetical protein CMN21_24370 [Rubinisphaera sp.]|nr:hypothetical protein [Rubinisphaera sp.]